MQKGGETIGPRARVEQLLRSSTPVRGKWLVVWNIQNLGREQIEIVAGRLPHSQFRAEEQQLRPSPLLLPDESARLEFEVACDGPPGAVVENAFLILSVRWLSEPWRILARLRVVFDDESGPQTTTELVTTQRVGFSVTRAET